MRSKLPNHPSSFCLYFIVIILSVPSTAAIKVVVNRSGGTTCGMPPMRFSPNNPASKHFPLPGGTSKTTILPPTTITLRYPSANNTSPHGGSYSSQSYAPAPMPGKVSENKMRVFTSTEGNTVEARILSINTVNRTARIRTGKGLAYSVPFGRFCESDLSYLKAWWINRNPPRKLSGYKAFLARRKG